jgi:N-acetylglutamate synthase-like GNAT family acetyltransferase
MKPKKEKISEQIKIVVNDEKVTYQELKTLFTEMNKTDEYDAADIFYYNVRNETKEKEAIENSTFITARLNNKLVGMVRVVGDSTYEYYISEVMVIPKLQGCHIGTKLMKATLDYCKKGGFMKIFLTAAKGRESYYRKFGFKITDYNVMRIIPDKT